jgi:hypothetical protein
MKIPDTPDDIIVDDVVGNPQIVSGYSLNSGKGRRRTAVMYNRYPNRRYAAHARKQMKEHGNTRLFNRWLEDQSKNATRQVPFNQEWAQRWIRVHSHDDPAYYNDPVNMRSYSMLLSLIHNVIKREVPNATK